jgi:hypothetical protein
MGVQSENKFLELLDLEPRRDDAADFPTLQTLPVARTLLGGREHAPHGESRA